MINIRTITYNMPKLFNNEHFEVIKNCIKDWNQNKYYIRTTRINTTPIEKIKDINKYDILDKFCLDNNIKWFSIPISFKEKDKEKYINDCYSIIKKYDKAFINIDGVKDSTINFDLIDIYIDLMKKVSKYKNGKDNFRLGLSVNSISDSPFFPFTKSSGDFSFTIGLELTQEINKIINSYKSINYNELRDLITEKLDYQISEIENYAYYIEKKYDITFKGFDFSLAPIIEEDGSIMELIEKLGIKKFDGPGVMFVTAYLTNILKSFGNNHKHIGFSGVMYSLLEDIKLSKINNKEKLKLEDITKLSTMCGCGIDMIPIKYNVPKDIITSYILDIAAISCRLNKPLGVRFLPINILYNHTKFIDDKDFITNTRVLSLKNNILLYKNIKNFKFIEIQKKL